MREERLLDLLEQLPDDILEEALQYQKPAASPARWHKSSLVAACLSLFLIGSLAWDTLRSGVEATTAAGSAPTETVGEVPGQSAAPTGAQETAATGAQEAVISAFWYEGQRYVASGFVLTELSTQCHYQGTLFYDEPGPETMAAMEDWQTSDQTLAGANVYRLAGDSGFFVETEEGYRYYQIVTEGQ